jgi:hypothetical protein
VSGEGLSPLRYCFNPARANGAVAVDATVQAAAFYLLIVVPVRACLAARAEELRVIAAGPVFLHVGTTFEEPTEVWYDPTEGATTDPYPSVPVVCASANVLVSVSAVASAMVVIFMVGSPSSLDRRQPRHPLIRSVQLFFSEPSLRHLTIL